MKLLSLNFWVSTLISTLITMCMIFLIKKFTQKVNVPVLSQVVAEV